VRYIFGQTYPLPDGVKNLTIDMPLTTRFANMEDEGCEIALVPKFNKNEVPTGHFNFTPAVFKNTKQGFDFGWHQHPTQSEGGLLCSGSATIYLGEVVDVEGVRSIKITGVIAMGINDSWKVPAGVPHCMIEETAEHFSLINWSPKFKRNEWKGEATTSGLKAPDFEKYMKITKRFIENG